MASSPPPLSSHDDDEGPTVIIVVFVSFGFIFFTVFCLFALWCLLRKRKKKTVEVEEEIDIIRTDKHRRVKEAIVQGPHGPKTVILSVEEDKHVQKEIIKNEKKMEAEKIDAKSGEITTADIETGESSSNPPSIHQNV
ncbi:hypothetical protein PHJA_002382100 [Phtheirospermum japonicum]|uniref:Uncharacterized protein n=1 Tax=Phtheirospermum japonicum TaxID=374723 RepID=A0A830CR68_9LAMI|nr:hypothetical protein PHJA_002382100 [Phtheirospermum japonicum]